MEIAIDRTGSAVERRLIFVDKNRDMFMTQVRVYGTARKTVKLCKLPADSVELSRSLFSFLADCRKRRSNQALFSSFLSCLLLNEFCAADLRPFNYVALSCVCVLSLGCSC